MRYAYVTKREAPQGYVAVTKVLARLLYTKAYPVTVCGSNVNAYHVFHGWYLGYTLPYTGDSEDFDKAVNSYVFNSSPELLRYPVFYVKREVITNMDLSLLEERKCYA